MSDKYVLKTKALADKIAADLGLVIEDVEWVKESGVYILRILADKEEGIFDIDDATKLNEEISKKLDEEDYIEEEYMLEVSSVGAERELKCEKDMLKSINSYVHIDLNTPINIIKDIKIHDIEGTLLEVNDNSVVLSINLKGRIKKVIIEKENIKLIRKAIKF